MMIQFYVFNEALRRNKFSKFSSHLYNGSMLTYLIPILYSAAVILLLLQAARVMARGFETSNRTQIESSKNIYEDRTGRVTIHPEILNKDGSITDEDLLTVRFSKDIDPPQSA